MVNQNVQQVLCTRSDAHTKEGSLLLLELDQAQSCNGIFFGVMCPLLYGHLQMCLCQSAQGVLLYRPLQVTQFKLKILRCMHMHTQLPNRYSTSDVGRCKGCWGAACECSLLAAAHQTTAAYWLTNNTKHSEPCSSSKHQCLNAAIWYARKDTRLMLQQTVISLPKVTCLRR